MAGGAPIRRAEAGDAGRLSLLAGQLGYSVAEKAARERLAALERDPGQAVLVAGRPAVAFLHLKVIDSFLGPRETEIEALVVDEAARSRGVGRALVEEAIRYARERGCARVRVRSRVERDRAHAFYEREGFSRVKTQLVFLRDL